MSYAMTALAGMCLGAFQLESDEPSKVALGFGTVVFSIFALICATKGL